jgi:hypothetical protein
MGLLSNDRSESWALAAAVSELFDLKAVQGQYSDYSLCADTHVDGTWDTFLASSLA